MVSGLVAGNGFVGGDESSFFLLLLLLMLSVAGFEVAFVDFDDLDGKMKRNN